MELKHGPGPWFVELDGRKAMNIRCLPDEEDGGTHVAEMQSSRSPDETRANAVLMAAAPELLAALKKCIQYMPTYAGEAPTDSGMGALNAALNAIHDAATLTTCRYCGRHIKNRNGEWVDYEAWPGCSAPGLIRPHVPGAPLE